MEPLDSDAQGSSPAACRAKGEVPPMPELGAVPWFQLESSSWNNTTWQKHLLFLDLIFATIQNLWHADRPGEAFFAVVFSGSSERENRMFASKKNRNFNKSPSDWKAKKKKSEVAKMRNPAKHHETIWEPKLWTFWLQHLQSSTWELIKLRHLTTNIPPILVPT